MEDFAVNSITVAPTHNSIGVLPAMGNMVTTVTRTVTGLLNENYNCTVHMGKRDIFTPISLLHLLICNLILLEQREWVYYMNFNENSCEIRTPYLSLLDLQCDVCIAMHVWCQRKENMHESGGSGKREGGGGG